MASTDIRLKRNEKEYQSVRGGQDDGLDRIDTYEEALLGLTQAVAANHDLIMANRDLIMANHDLIMANHDLYQRQFADLNEKIDRLMTHLDVPPRPPAGFVKECRGWGFHRGGAGTTQTNFIRADQALYSTLNYYYITCDSGRIRWEI